MYKTPFIILKEKVPFIEFFYRAFSFFINPKVENEVNFPAGNTRYALWDIILSLTIVGIISSFITLFNGTLKLSKIADLFGGQFEILLHFGYYAYVSSAIFLLVLIVIFLLKKNNNILKTSFLSAMHYARCYSLFLVIFIPIVYLAIYQSTTKMLNVNDFLYQHPKETLTTMFILIAIYLWCCVRPLHLYLQLFKNKFWSYSSIIVLTNASFAANVLVIEPPGLSINSDIACELLQRSEKFKNMSAWQKNEFIKQCKNRLAKSST